MEILLQLVHHKEMMVVQDQLQVLEIIQLEVEAEQ
jgi:hypothetical protein